MAHVRQQIRDKVYTLLKVLPTTGANCFKTRLHPFFNDEAELPGLCIYTSSEESEREEDDSMSHIQYRYVSIVVEGYEALTMMLEDTLDRISSEVEAAMYADQFLGGLSHSIDLVSTEIEISGEAEKPVGVVTLNFRVFYLTLEAAPETAL